MRAPVTFNSRVRYETKVSLTKTLPTNRDFKNTCPLPAGTVGYVVSKGFEAGMLTVLFDTYGLGSHRCTFNERCAAEFLDSLYV